ncbi:heme peroxidase [Powellomyces hirtus]|nr:heme peroxidase [Powellomyces hirtus]
MRLSRKHAAATVVAGFVHADVILAAGPNIPALRTLMTDSRFVGLISPCDTGGSVRSTAAEWIRTVFHDAATFDKATRTGGIDGSLYWEMERAENGGRAIPTTLLQFDTFKQDGISIADMTVLGAVVSIMACGGPEIPFRAGRLDAFYGNQKDLTPLPTHSLATHTQMFSRMGFSSTDMIKLVACGHTVGGVHGETHPELTNERVSAWDSTRAAFDHNVAAEWINGTSVNVLARPLGVDEKFGSRSDARIFEMDGNTTMRALAASRQAFNEECKDIFTRMFDEAVPGIPQLTSTVLAPFPVSIGFNVKLRNERFLIEIGSARLWKMAGTHRRINIGYTTRNGDAGLPDKLFLRPLRTLMGGNLEIIDFSGRGGFDPVAGVSSITVTVLMNDGTLFVDRDQATVVPVGDTINIDQGEDFTCILPAANATSRGLSITVAVLGKPKEQVFFLYRHIGRGETTNQRMPATYLRAREGTGYQYYGASIPDVNAWDNGLGFGIFGAEVIKNNGETRQDLNQGKWFNIDRFNDCKVAVPPSTSATMAQATTTSTDVSVTTTEVATVTEASAMTEPDAPSSAPITSSSAGVPSTTENTHVSQSSAPFPTSAASEPGSSLQSTSIVMATSSSSLGSDGTSTTVATPTETGPCATDAESPLIVTITDLVPVPKRTTPCTDGELITTTEMQDVTTPVHTQPASATLPLNPPVYPPSATSPSTPDDELPVSGAAIGVSSGALIFFLLGSLAAINV